MRIKNIMFCFLSVLLIIGGILMYRLTTSTKILETPVMIGKIYIWGYRVLTPVGIIGSIISAVKITKDYPKGKKEDDDEEIGCNNTEKAKDSLSNEADSMDR